MESMKIIPRDLFLIYWMLPISNLLRFLTIMLGDGSHDDIKHFFTVNFEFDAMIMSNCILLFFILTESMWFHKLGRKLIQKGKQI